MHSKVISTVVKCNYHRTYVVAYLLKINAKSGVYYAEKLKQNGLFAFFGVLRKSKKLRKRAIALIKWFRAHKFSLPNNKYLHAVVAGSS